LSVRPERLFFYGVLIGDLASPAIRQLLSGLGPGLRASTTGTLFAVLDPRGAYPVLVPGEGTVHGMLHEAGSVDLVALDAFEGIEYRRQPVTVALANGGSGMADAYVYQFAPRPEFLPIAHGDFARWLRETGTAPLAG